MRIIYLVLISFVSAFARGAPEINLFQARGLKKGKCYQQMASLVCKDKCALDLFPTTQAQITLNIREISQKDRLKMGHLFNTRFKVLNNEANEIEILGIMDASLNEFMTSIHKSTGLVTPKSCK